MGMLTISATAGLFKGVLDPEGLGWFQFHNLGPKTAVAGLCTSSAFAVQWGWNMDQYHAARPNPPLEYLRGHPYKAGFKTSFYKTAREFKNPKEHKGFPWSKYS